MHPAKRAAVGAAVAEWQRGSIPWAELLRRADLTTAQAEVLKREAYRTMRPQQRQRVLDAVAAAK